MPTKWYDPELGRFIQEDPLGTDAGVNLYIYAGNDPVNGWDPMGLDDDSYRLLKMCIDRAYDEFAPGGRVGSGDGPKLYQAIASCYAQYALPLPGVTVTAKRPQPSAPLMPSMPSGGGSGGYIPGIGGVGGGNNNKQPKSTWGKVKECVAAQYGFGNGDTPTALGLAKIGSEIASLPVFKPLVGVPVIIGSSRFTNVLNYGFFVLGVRTKFSGAAVRSFTKTAFGSIRVGTVLGRANVVIGGALLAYDAASIGICTARGD